MQNIKFSSWREKLHVQEVKELYNKKKTYRRMLNLQLKKMTRLKINIKFLTKALKN
jgi:hypothetical protein